MKDAVFQSGGLALGPLRYPPLTIAAGGAAGWTTYDQQSSNSIMETVLGLRPPPPGGAVWFGRDLAGEHPADVLRILRRLAPLSAGGGLIGNLNLGDNILLPVDDRRPAGRDQAVATLERLIEQPPWPSWLDAAKLTCLPFQCSPLERVLAAVLRARLLEPEAIVACHVSHLLERDGRRIAADALAWLRSELPGAAWLVLQAESPLPAGFAGNTLEPER
jgi:hypothetical protein